MNLLRLVYVSRADGEIDSAMLDGILSVARRRNDTFGVTGVLCTGRGYFVQVLEGLETEVLALYGGILRDPRHQDISLLSIGLVASRAFPNWSMSHIDGSRLSAAALKRLTSKVAVERNPSASVKALQAAVQELHKAP